MITANTLQVIDYAVLAVSGVCVLVCLAVAAFAAPWTRAMRSARASRQFNRLWLARVLMELAAALWLLWALLRMMALWGVRSKPGRVSNLTSEALCRIYLGFSLGLLQPLFLLLALLLCQSSLSHSPRRRREMAERSSWGIVGLAALCTAPVLAVQVVMAWFSKIFQKHDWEHTGNSLPRYFFGVYHQGDAAQCANDAPGCIVCIYPAAMVIVTGLFSIAFLVALCAVSSRLAATCINRRLLRRMRTFELGMNLLVVTSVALLGASVATNPFNLVWQLLLIFYSVTNCAMALLATWLLVAVPIYIAKSADRLATAEWWEEEDDMEHALGGGDGATGPPQEMALLDKRPGTLSDDVSSGSGSETGSHGGSSRGGGPGGSRKSLLQPSSLKSSSQASF